MLQSDQPLTSKELAESLGVSKVSILRDLKRLMTLDLVCQIKFEQHVYYCVNGLFKNLIDTNLIE